MSSVEDMRNNHTKIIEKLFHKNKDKKFIYSGGEWATYGEILYNAEKNSKIIKCDSPKKRINIGLVLPNSRLYVEWLFGIVFSGNIAVPIFYNTSVEEIKNTIISCDLDLLICDNEIAEKCKRNFGDSFIRQINVITNY